MSAANSRRRRRKEAASRRPHTCEWVKYCQDFVFNIARVRNCPEINLHVMVLEDVHGDSQVVGHRLVQLIKTKEVGKMRELCHVLH